MTFDTAAKVIILNYKREGKEETFRGTIHTAGVQRLAFAGAPFNRLLEFASDELRLWPDHALVLKREEAPYPMLLPEGIEELLRTDLDAAIAALTVEPQRVVVAPPRGLGVAQGLVHGHDTLADAIGDEVYLKVRLAGAGHQLESPVTGRWEDIDTQLTVTQGVYFPVRHPGRSSLPLSPLLCVASGRWVTVRVEHLLSLELPRYYLPRRWNPNEGWIDHEALADMYAFYRKEKSDVTNQ